MIWTACRSGSISQNAIYLTKGGLELYGLQIEKSAEVIVVEGYEPMREMEVSQLNEGLNIK